VEGFGMGLNTNNVFIRNLPINIATYKETIFNFVKKNIKKRAQEN
jgi:hypothetical protein